MQRHSLPVLVALAASLTNCEQKDVAIGGAPGPTGPVSEPTGGNAGTGAWTPIGGQPLSMGGNPASQGGSANGGAATSAGGSAGFAARAGSGPLAGGPATDNNTCHGSTLFATVKLYQPEQEVAYAYNVDVTADFNGDGKLDVVGTTVGTTDNEDGEALVVSLGTGDGSLEPEAIYPIGGDNANGAIANVDLAAGDFNRDSRLDLVAAVDIYDGGTYQLSLKVLLGYGDGKFAAPLVTPVASLGRTIRVADFNLDGKPDVVTGSTVHLGQGDGTLGPSLDIPGSAYQVGDFNLDQIPDLLAIDWETPEERVLLGRGDATFAAQPLLSGAALVFTMDVGDFNQDNRPDVVLTGVWPSGVECKIGVLLGNGDGTFAAPLVDGWPPVVEGSPLDLDRIVTADVDVDGRLDLVYFTSEGFTVRFGNGDGTFAPPQRFAAPAAGVVGDFNLDQTPDVGSLAGVAFGAGNRQFYTPREYAIGDYPGGAPLTGDFDQDGTLDIVTSDDNSSGVNVLIGRGDGTFAPPVSYATDWARPADTGDFNLDGHLDLVVKMGSSGVGVLIGNGDGTFAPPPKVVYPTGTPSSIAVGDFNLDEQLDLAVAQDSSEVNSPASLGVYLGMGDGTFGTELTHTLDLPPTSLVVGDYNLDGLPDVAMAAPNDLSTQGTLNLSLGRGDGTFAPATTLAAGPQFFRVATRDVNLDGRLDLAAVAQRSSAVTVFLGNGNGTFAPGVDYPTPTTPRYEPDSVVLEDIDVDGWPDLVVVVPHAASAIPIVAISAVSVFLNHRDGTFGPRQDYFSRGAREVAVADFNQDHRPDLAVTGATYTRSWVSVIMGRCAP